MWVSSFVFKSEFILTGRHGKWVIMNHKILYCILKIVLKFPSEFQFTFWLSGRLWIYTPAPHRSHSGVWPVCKCRLGRSLKPSESHLWSKEILYILCFLFLTFVNLFCKYPLLLLPLPPDLKSLDALIQGQGPVPAKHTLWSWNAWTPILAQPLHASVPSSGR